MNPLIKQRWVSALRSPAYKQIVGSLALRKDDDEKAQPACTLGCLMFEAELDGIVRWVVDSDHSGHWEVPELVRGESFQPIRDQRGQLQHTGNWELWDNETLPLEVVEWAGLTDDNPNLLATITWEDEETGDSGEYEESQCIAGLNDEHGYSFDELAKLIDDQL